MASEPRRSGVRRAYPLLALAAIALAFVALVSLSSVALRGARLDLTDKGLYTLSPGTLAILGKVDASVEVDGPALGIAGAIGFVNLQFVHGRALSEELSDHR